MDTTDNGTDAMSVPGSLSYTDPGAIMQSESGSQSVQTVHSQGTHSPIRGQHTPMSTSPASASQKSIHPDVMGTLEPMPQYSTPLQVPHLSHLQRQPQQQQPSDSGFLLGMRQLERQALDHHHMQVQVMHQQQHHQQQRQQHQLHNTYSATRDRSNPVSDDEQTEPSSSANTGAENTANSGVAGGYTRSDAGAISTFGRLIQSANKVSPCLFVLFWCMSAVDCISTSETIVHFFTSRLLVGFGKNNVGVQSF